MRIAMIGMGEVGCTFFDALNSHNVKVCCVAEKRISPRASELCKRYDAILAEDLSDAIDHAELFLSCVEGETAQIITEILADKGRPGQVLIDFSTASAATKRKCSQILQQRGIAYVDIAIMGAIALTGHKTKMIAAGVTPTGAGEQGIALLTQGGLSISVIENSQAGDAISLKLLRSIFTKGLEALTVECLATAEHLGVRENLYDVLADVDNTPLPDFMEMLIQTHLVHAARRGKEVQRAHEQVESLGLTSIMLPAIEAVFARTAQSTPITTSDLPDTRAALHALIRICEGNTAAASNA